MIMASDGSRRILAGVYEEIVPEEERPDGVNALDIRQR